jgi:hypothetical protein
MPNAVWVRSLVPKLKNSASQATSPAVSAARGISIMVPTMYFSPVMLFFSRTSLATFTTISFWLASSVALPTSGIMTSGITLMPFFFTATATSKIARACISVISG